MKAGESPTKGGPAKPRRMCAFRFTEAEAMSIGQIANAIEKKMGVHVSKTDVLRAGLRLMAEKWLKAPRA